MMREHGDAQAGTAAAVSVVESRLQQQRAEALAAMRLRDLDGAELQPLQWEPVLGFVFVLEDADAGK